MLAPFLLGPFGSIVAIAVGWAARHEIASDRANLRGFRMATVGMVLGFMTMMVWAGGAAAWAWVFIERSHAPLVSAPPPPVKGVPTVVVIESPQEPPPAPQAAPTPTPTPGGSVPQDTEVKREGSVTVVTVGVSASSLGDELKKQLALAKSAGQTLLVMTTRDGCDPCRGVERSLSDPRMQTALADVRLVRVDIDVFQKDLDTLKMPRRVYPSFFLLAPDLWVRDGIDGGEWDDDIAVNIAPVLGAFVRGTYNKRRSPWHEPAGSGISL